ncbi:MAG: hypothetical protein QNJ00_00980 [Woeseiaceae bacterium]|nr:hypothetical protein [Woeseiaceae bacterium]
MTVFAPLRYGLHMRPVSKFIVILASVSFLTITLSGSHLHADAASHDEKAPHEHIHSYLAPPELDEDHVDISVCEPATGFSKGETVAPITALTELEPVPRAACPLSAGRQDPVRPNHSRWRPELRGPPFPG